MMEQSLPPEILRLIFRHFNEEINQLLVLRLTCRQWNDTIVDAFGKRFFYQLDFSKNRADATESQEQSDIYDKLLALSQEDDTRNVYLKNWDMYQIPGQSRIDMSTVEESSQLITRYRELIQLADYWRPHWKVLSELLERNATRLEMSNMHLFSEVWEFFILRCPLESFHGQMMHFEQDRLFYDGDRDMRPTRPLAHPRPPPKPALSTLTELTLTACINLTDTHLFAVVPALVNLRSLDLTHNVIECTTSEFESESRVMLIQTYKGRSASPVEMRWRYPSEHVLTFNFILAMLTYGLPSLVRLSIGPRLTHQMAKLLIAFYRLKEITLLAQDADNLDVLHKATQEQLPQASLHSKQCQAISLQHGPRTVHCRIVSAWAGCFDCAKVSPTDAAINLDDSDDSYEDYRELIAAYLLELEVRYQR